MKTYIAYYRVSTAKQGASGLGLDAQRMAVASFVGSGEIVQEYTEVESGKVDARPMLTAAMATARETGSTLVIAKLDRLSRNASFVFALRDAGVNFVCADMPDANSLTIGIFACLAQHERETISRRTREALAAKKANGFALGTPANLTAASRVRSLEVRTLARRECPEWIKARALVVSMRGTGGTFREIAEALNVAGFLTRTGKGFAATTVKRLADQGA